MSYTNTSVGIAAKRLKEAITSQTNKKKDTLNRRKKDLNALQDRAHIRNSTLSGKHISVIRSHYS